MFFRVVFPFHVFKLGFPEGVRPCIFNFMYRIVLNQGCKPWLSRIRFHASFVGKITLLPFRCALSFHLSKSRSCVQSFDSFQANKIQLHVSNLRHARLCGSLAKELKLFYGELWRKVSRKQSYKTKIFNHSVASF